MRMISPARVRAALAGIGIAAAAAVSVTSLAPAQAAATGRHGPALRSAVATRIPLAHLPRSIAADPLTGMIYVSEFGGELQVIDGRTNSVVASMTVPGKGAPFVAVDPLTDRIYVTGGTHVSVISGRTNTVVATIRMYGASFLATDPLTDRVYVEAGYVGSLAGKLAVIDGRTNKVVAAIRHGNGSWGVATDPVTNTVYAGDAVDSLWVIDGRTNKVTATVPAIQGSDIATNPLTHTVYVPDPFTDGGGGQTFVIDGRTNAITANIKLNGTPYDVAVDLLTNKVYVAMANTHASWVSVLSGSR